MRQIKTTATAMWTTAAALGFAGLASPGCQRYVNVPRGEVKNEPVAIDEAMQIRDWEPSSARYTNPRFIAGPTGYWFQPAYDMPAPVYALQETPMFVLQTLALPVTVWFPPLYTPVEYAGETLEPTWHAMPPLPEAQYGERAAPAETIEPATETEPMPPAPDEPGAAAPAPTPVVPSEPVPAQSTTPRAEPMREIRPQSTTPAPAAQPSPAPRSLSTPTPSGQSTASPTTRPATQPAVSYTPSSVAPTRTTTTTTRPSTVPVRDMNK